MNHIRRLLAILWILVVGSCLLTITSEAIHQRRLEQRTREFQKSCPDQEKLKKQLEQIQAIEQ